MATKHLLVLSTGQHVGKTTVSLGLVKSLQTKYRGSDRQVAYCKPVGQQHVPVGNGLRVDKDAFLFKEHFGLVHDYRDMSPVIFPDGFTRDFIDGKVTEQELAASIERAHANLYHESDFLICEGTGHTGVGSICELNNAQVAAKLNMDVVCIALGGLGSSFDQLAMNRELLVKHNVRMRGVILNKVNPQKMDMIKDYFSRALKRWDVPLVGCIPELKDLSCPTMADYSKLLKSPMISGEFSLALESYGCGASDLSNAFFFIVTKHRERSRHALLHEHSTRARSSEREKPLQGDPEPARDHGTAFLICRLSHSGRHDVIDAILGNQEASMPRGQNLMSGLILTGWEPPSDELAKRLEADNIPCIYVAPSQADSYTLTARIAQFTAKLRRDDTVRLEMAADHVSKHCDFSFLD